MQIMSASEIIVDPTFHRSKRFIQWTLEEVYTDISGGELQWDPESSSRLFSIPTISAPEYTYDLPIVSIFDHSAFGGMIRVPTRTVKETLRERIY